MKILSENNYSGHIMYIVNIIYHCPYLITVFTNTMMNKGNDKRDKCSDTYNRKGQNLVQSIIL